MSTAVLQPASDTLLLRRTLPALALLAVAALFAVLGLRAGDRPAPHSDVTTLPTRLGTWRMVASEHTDPTRSGIRRRHFRRAGP